MSTDMQPDTTSMVAALVDRIVAVFRPGVPAPVHDHGSWAVIGIYRGRERETWFRRANHEQGPGRARLEVVRSFVNETGAVSTAPDGMIHTVQALDGRDAVSIHVYGTDIVTQQRSTFDLDTGTEEIFRPDFAEPRPEPSRTGDPGLDDGPRQERGPPAGTMTGRGGAGAGLRRLPQIRGPHARSAGPTQTIPRPTRTITITCPAGAHSGYDGRGNPAQTRKRDRPPRPAP
jgi:hypothetical protein